MYCGKSLGTSLAFFQLYVTGLRSFINESPAVLKVIFSFNLSSEEAAHEVSEPFNSKLATLLPAPTVILLFD